MELNPFRMVDVQDWMWASSPFRDIRWQSQAVSGFSMVGKELLEQMSPVEFGGEMIDLSMSEAWKELPWKV